MKNKYAMHLESSFIVPNYPEGLDAFAFCDSENATVDITVPAAGIDAYFSRDDLEQMLADLRDDLPEPAVLPEPAANNEPPIKYFVFAAILSLLQLINTDLPSYDPESRMAITNWLIDINNKYQLNWIGPDDYRLIGKSLRP